jgi:hypothetical protein
VLSGVGATVDVGVDGTGGADPNLRVMLSLVPLWLASKVGVRLDLMSKTTRSLSGCVPRRTEAISESLSMIRVLLRGAEIPGTSTTKRFGFSTN